MYEGYIYELWKYRSLRINLIITTVLWTVLTIGYNELNLLLKYLEGNMYVNSYTLASGEILAKLIGGIILTKTGLQRLHYVAFGFATVGAFLMACFYKIGALTPFLVFFTRFGIGMAWFAVYFDIVILFPTILKSTSAGIASFFAKLGGISVPYIAEITPPFNIIVLFAAALLALCLSTCLIVLKTKKEV